MYSYKDKLNIVIIIDYNEYNTTKGYSQLLYAYKN